MAEHWIEAITGSLEQKRRYWRHQARVKRLPEGYRTAVVALERYLMYFGRGDGAGAMAMLDDLADLFEQSAADRTPIRDVVGDDPVEFVDAFIQNYPEGQWRIRERERLIGAIHRAEEMGPR